MFYIYYHFCYHGHGGTIMTIGKKISKLRTEKKLTQKQLADICGFSQSALNFWENGKRQPKREQIEKIAKFFNFPFYLLLDDNFDLENAELERKHIKSYETIASPKKKGVVINILGRIAAGIPVEAVEEIIDTEEISEEMARTGTFFGLKIKGDSMTPGICDGDVVIVKKQPDAENGEIVIATVNGTDAVCKRLRKYREGIELISNNPSYAPMEFSNKDISDLPVCIIGKVVELRRKF